MNTELIQLKEVSKKFGKNIVLENLNLNIPEKEITCIVGASGIGKSTILKLIIGLYKPDKGEVLYLKRNVLNDLNNVKKSFGFSFEDGSFYEELTVRENLIYFGKLYGIKNKKIKENIKETLEFLDLNNAADIKAKNLSVGMKKRLDLACSLIHKPEVLILDEPTADLDLTLRKQIISLIKEIKKRGTTVILTTQILEEIEELECKVAILNDKKIIICDSADKIKLKYSANNLNEVFEKIFSIKKDRSKEKRGKNEKDT